MKKTKFEWAKHHIELMLAQSHVDGRYDEKEEIKAEVYEDILYFMDSLENIKK